MTGKRVEKSWTWHLKAPRESLWPLVSDTERMNEALRLPPYRLRETIGDDGQRRRYGEYEDQGTTVRWEEPPFEWAHEHWWRWDRLYESGPLERARGTLVMEPDRKGGTVATYTLVAEPRSAAGSILARTGHLKEAGKAMERLLKLADAHVRRPHGDFYATIAATRAAARKRKGNAYKVPADLAPGDRETGQQVLDWLAIAFESDLREIRARRVARALGIGVVEAHSAMVVGTEMGALVRRFRLVCAHCHTNVREVALPRDLPATLPCPRCERTVETDYARTVEVVFEPHPTFRAPSPLVHCASGPGVSPRIVLQQILEPHERRDLPATLAGEAHGVRMLESGARLDLDATAGTGALIRVGDDWIESPGAAETVVLENHGERVVTVIVQRAAWPADATPLSEWLTYQRCRDATPAGTLDLEEPRAGGTASLVVVSARGADEAPACRRIALVHGGAVVEDTGAGTLLVFGHPARAMAAMDAALQALPAARIGADHGPLSLVSGLRYDGDARERVGELAGLAQEGVPNLSPAFRAALEG